MSENDEYALKFHRFFRFSDYRAIENWDNLKLAILPNMNLLNEHPAAFVNNFDPFVPRRFAKWMAVINELGPDQQKVYLALMNVGVRLNVDISQPILGITTTGIPGSRIWWSPCANWVPDETNSLEEVGRTFNNQQALLSSTLILEGDPHQKDHECINDPGWSTKLLVDQPNQVTISVESAQDGFLFLGDTWFPGWSATIDDQPTEIYHANYLFRAVEIRAGKHTVIFTYSPGSFYIGGGISFGMTSFMILWLLLLTHRVKLSMIANQENHT